MKLTIEVSDEVMSAIDSITLLTGLTSDEVIKQSLAINLHLQTHVK